MKSKELNNNHEAFITCKCCGKYYDARAYVSCPKCNYYEPL